MSMVLTRSPLEAIGMNGAAGMPKRRSARLSAEGTEENEPPAKKNKVNGGTTVATKEGDGDAGAAGKKKRKVYEEADDDFAFSKSKRSKAAKSAPARSSTTERTSPAKPARQAPTEEVDPTTTRKKPTKRLPTTPEAASKKPVRRSKRLSDENEKPNDQTTPHKGSHARSHAKTAQSPSPFKSRPVTVEKKRRKGEEGMEEEKIMRIQLPFADTPVIKRNKEMRKASAETGPRRSSAGMRGRRASSLIDEGRGNEASELALTREASTRRQSCSEFLPAFAGLSTPPPSKIVVPRLPLTDNSNETFQETFADDSPLPPALPHSEVSSAEFFKHISAELTEPRRMRCLLGWCGTRALPPKPEAPKENTAASNLEFQALQAARVIQEELSQDLTSKGVLSDWFSRDDSAPPQVPLRKKPNPRNVANATKAEELERELERLKKERAEWDNLLASAATASSPTKKSTTTDANADADSSLSPLDSSLLDSPQRHILEQLQAGTINTDPPALQQRLRNVSSNLEFTVDQFAHGIHALSTTQATAERLADRSLADAAGVLEEREREQRGSGRAVGAMDALRGLAKVLNSGKR